MNEDTVRVRIDFMTDESGKFAKTILEAQKFNKEIKDAQKEVNRLEKEIEAMDKKDLSTIGTKQKLAEAQKRLTEAINGSVMAGQSLSQIDLKNVAPSQLQERLRQVNQQLKQIPENIRTSHPEAKALKDEADRIGAALASVNARARAIAPALDSAKTGASGLGGIFQQAFSVFLGGGLLGIVQQIMGGLKSLFTASLEASGQFESANISFEVMLGSAVKAKKLIAELQKLAASTPFETDELIDYSKRLLAMGISAESIVPTMTALGNIAAGVGKEKLPQLVLAFGQVQTKTKLAGGELKQFTEAGVPLVAALATQFNKTEAEIFKMSEAGKIGFKDVEKAIFSMSAAGGKFENLMARQSLTLSGLWSTFKDNITLNVLIPLGDAIGSFLKPLVTGFNDFFGQLSAYFKEGKKPIGEYAEVIEYAGRILRILGNVFSIVFELAKPLFGFILEQIKVVAWLGNRIGDLVGWFVSLAAEAKKIPLIGAFFKPILDAVGLLSDLLSNASATFAGFRAAAQQSIINVQNYLKALVIDTEIMAAKLISALSLDKATKESIAKQIAVWESQKSAMFATGKSVEQAYTEGRNAAMAVQVKAEAEAETKKRAAKKIAAETDEKEAKKAEKERLERIKRALEIELDANEIGYRKAALVNEIAFLKKEKSESDFNKKSLELEKDKYEAQIKIYDTYQKAFSEKSKEFQDLEIKKLEAQKKLIETNAQLTPRNAQEVERLGTRQSTGVKSDLNDPLSKIQVQADLEKSTVRQKFADLLTMEQQFEIKRLEIQSKAFADQMAVLKANGAEKTDEYKRLADAQKEIDKDIVENKKQLADIEKAIQNDKQEIYKSALSVASDLFTSQLEAEKAGFKEKSDKIQDRLDVLKKAGKEESAEYKKLTKEKQAVDDEELAVRKKRGETIKAFQIGQIVINGILEVQKIWAQVAEYGPAGPVIGAIMTALTVARSATAINRVQSQKFALGGMVKSGIFGGQPHSAGGTKGYFEDGTAIEVERGEAFAVINKKNTPLLKALSFVNSHNGNGRPFFADGGVMGLNTTPFGFNNQTTPSVSVSFNIDALAAKLDKLTDTVASQRTQFKAFVVVDEFEAKQTSIKQDRADAAY